MMTQRDIADFLTDPAVQDCRCFFHMRLHDCHFRWGQPSGIFQNVQRNADFPQVMEHSGNFQRLLIISGNAAPASQLHCRRGGDHRVRNRVAGTKVDDDDQHRQQRFYLAR